MFIQYPQFWPWAPNDRANISTEFEYTRCVVLIATFKFLAILENGKSIPMRWYTTCIRHLRTTEYARFLAGSADIIQVSRSFPAVQSACTRTSAHMHSWKFRESSMNPMTQRKIRMQLKSAVSLIPRSFPPGQSAWPNQYSLHFATPGNWSMWIENCYSRIPPPVCLSSVYLMSLYVTRSPRPSPSVFAYCK